MIREGYPTDDGATQPVPTEEMKWVQSPQPVRFQQGFFILKNPP